MIDDENMIGRRYKRITMTVTRTDSAARGLGSVPHRGRTPCDGQRIRPRPFGMSIAELLSSPKRSRKHLKARLVRAGLLQNSCSLCGLHDWKGRPLSLHLDHVNGVPNDNRLENLRMLCPNCHSQTPTYGGRNVRRGVPVAREEASGVV